MSGPSPARAAERAVAQRAEQSGAREIGATWLKALITPLSRPWVAGLTALTIYLLRALVSPQGMDATQYAYYNYLADAFLHGQLGLRVLPPQLLDLLVYHDQVYLYWPPFPVLLLMPLVAIFGYAASDVAFAVVLGAATIALLAKVLAAFDRTGLAPLSAERRGILVATCAFGTFLLFLVPTGRVWYTGQVIGWGCILLVTLAALNLRGARGYFLVALALACAMATRMPLIFNGLWLGYYLLRRDWHQPRLAQARAIGAGLVPVVVTLLLLGWYNWARFGSPLDTGLAWQQVGGIWRDDLARWGQFNLHYLPKNLYYHFIAYPLFPARRWYGGGLFWMTPVLFGAWWGLWQARRNPFTWVLVASCVLLYAPSGLLIGTGWVTFGPRYILDLLVPLLLLTAIGIRQWRLDLLQLLMCISCLTYLAGSALWLFEYQV